MMTETQIKTATLEKLNDELAAGGMPSGETDIHSARRSVRAMVAELRSPDRAVPRHLIIGPAREK